MKLVVKIGGSVLRSGKDFVEAARYVSRFESAVVVVSAMKGVTDLLITLLETRSPSAMARIESTYYSAMSELGIFDDPYISFIIRELREAAMGRSEVPEAARGAILSVGERLSARIMYLVLRRMGLDAAMVERPLITDDSSANANPLPDSVPWIREYVNYASYVVVPGFIGVSRDGRWTTIGRGGSDFTATFIAAAIGSPEVHLITEVEGIYSGDPAKVRDPLIVPQMSINEALALARVGGKRFHTRTFEPLIGTKTVVRVKNYSSRGTAISDSHSPPPIKVAHESPSGTYLIGEGVSKLGLNPVDCCIVEVPEPIDVAHEKYVRPLYLDFSIL